MDIVGKVDKYVDKWLILVGVRDAGVDGGSGWVIGWRVRWECVWGRVWLKWSCVWNYVYKHTINSDCGFGWCA